MLRLEKPSDEDLLLPALQAVVHGGLLAIHAAPADLLKAALDLCNSLAPEPYVMRGHSGRTAFLFIDRKKLRDPVRRLPPPCNQVLRIPTRTKLGLRAAKLKRRFRRKLSPGYDFQVTHFISTSCRRQTDKRFANEKLL